MRIYDFINKYNYGCIYEVIPSSLDGNKTTPIIIGITGSYGKSSCAQMLYQYLEYLGYIVAIYSSSKLNCPGTVYDNDQTQNDTSFWWAYVTYNGAPISNKDDGN